MSLENITARYRPKLFSEIAGQKNIKDILSTAAAKGSLAPAYLFSGTRGVGKTSTARIFVKALNCEKAPCAEPCNECHFCRQITRGACPDVLEIDGASNNGVEHVRRLTEEIAYAPLECRFKIIIIDEAHMLSKAAFNALLKTLEEPPKHAMFILATTEPEKFPPTIISRCQHYVFKALRGEELYTHLAGILKRENIGFEKEALEILVHRGNGSARDCMSLLAQMLVLGKERLTEEDVRSVLGLAHKNAQYAILEAIAGADTAQLHLLGKELLGQGLDIGFFLRELTQNWRNLFLLLELGTEAEKLLELSETELTRLRDISTRYTPGRVHASWQLTLEGQQRVLRSPDPALALEMLLVNLGCLSRLLPLAEAELHTDGEQKKKPEQQQRVAQTQQHKSCDEQKKNSQPAPLALANDQPAAPSATQSNPGQPDWAGFLAFWKEQAQKSGLPDLKEVDPVQDGDSLVLICRHQILYERLKSESQPLTAHIHTYFGPRVTVTLKEPEQKQISHKQLRELALQEKPVQELMKNFQARIVSVRPLDGPEESE